MYNNPSQINFEEIGGTTISEVKDIVTSLNGLYKEAKLMLQYLFASDITVPFHFLKINLRIVVHSMLFRIF